MGNMFVYANTKAADGKYYEFKMQIIEVKEISKDEYNDNSNKIGVFDAKNKANQSK